jgi:hypothetical protein
MFPEAVSNASSPNLPVLSPAANDPWYQVTQSKTAAGLEEMADVVGQPVMPLREERSGRLATWNHISQRLSMANVGGE